MQDFSIKPSDVFEVIQRQRKMLTTAFGTLFIGLMLTYPFVPRVYESETIIHLSASYFQNPLMGDLISQARDPNELKSERERLLKSSLGIDFANKVGERYKLFKRKKEDPDRYLEIEDFIKELNISTITATQYKIVFRANKPETADGVVKDAIAAIRQQMFISRIEMLEQFIGVLSNEIVSTHSDNLGKDAPTTGATATGVAKANAEAQIEQLEKRLEDLRRSYSDAHPIVNAVKTQIAELKSATERPGVLQGLYSRPLSGMSGKSAEYSQGLIRDSINKQKHLLNIALEKEKLDPTMSLYLTLIKEPVYPKKPKFPKLRLFLLFTIVTSVLGATLVVGASELWRTLEISPTQVSEKLNIPVIGSINITKTSSSSDKDTKP